MSIFKAPHESAKTLGAVQFALQSLVRLCVIIISISFAYAAPGPCPVPATGAFTGCYYDNLDLSGEPVLVRTDAQLQFDWANGLPYWSLSDSFSARWQGYFTFGAGGYTFTAVTSDGMRVFVDGTPVLDRWRDQPPYMYTFRLNLSAGIHLITVEYYEHSRCGTASLNWQPITPVIQPPIISSFTVNPGSITPGQAATLSWNLTSANSSAIDNGVGSVSGLNSVVVFPTTSTNYRLTATNGGGSSSSLAALVVNAVVDVQPPTAPALLSAIPKNQSQVDLSWNPSTAVGGVAGYQVIRNGVVVTSVAATSASYSDQGLAAGTGYTYSMKAVDTGGRMSSASNSLYATTLVTPAFITLNACADITQSGTYVLGKDLTGIPGWACINIHDTSNVELDCKQFSITVDRGIDTGGGAGLRITNATGYSVHNCSVKVLHTTATATMSALSVSNSPNGTLANNTISGGCIEISNSNRVQMTGNTLTATPLGVHQSDAVTISNNDINLPPTMTYAGNIVISRTTGSTIQNNRLDGGWDGGANRLGADVGILLDAVSNSIVSGNVIANTWDCGIENTGALSYVQLTDNKIRKTKFCGIGGWYGVSWKGNTVTGNTVEYGDAVFMIYRLWGLQAGEDMVYFKDNVVRNNSLLIPNPSVGAFRTSYIDFQNIPVAAGSVVAGNNVFSGNDFNKQGGAPIFFPASMIVDGGGNTCGAQNRQSDFPLNCGGSSSPVPPAPPTLLAATAKSQTQVDLTWASSPSAGVAGYQILRNGLVVNSSSAATSAYSDLGLSAGTSYSYTLRSFDSLGQVSPASNSIAVTTPAKPAESACPEAATEAFTGCFYNNLTLSGSPVAFKTHSVLSVWDWRSAVPAGITPGNFSAVFQGKFTFDGGTYTFVGYTSDGMRLYIDGAIALDQWKDQGVSGYYVNRTLTPGPHLLRVEYYNRTTDGLTVLYWM